MSTIEGITDGYGSVIGAPERDYADINSIDFMTLLVAQIRNQDPMSPMDNAEFTSQLTQFTMLEELEGMNAAMEENLLMSQSLNNTAMLALVGREVTVEGDVVSLSDGEATGNMVNVQGPGTATIEVTDESGNVIHTYTKDVDKGLADISWDGLLEDGTVAEDGDYTISVSIENGETEVPFVTLMTGPVEGIRYENNVAVVTVNDHEYYVSEIYKVS